ncbi:hypothetical protein [Cellulosimicrobium cellulans]|uniref:hypothetical protein n=1 Tax=Cellulosimicrobium cellulans TaxID=1710 RepID=UPI00301735A7
MADIERFLRMIEDDGEDDLSFVLRDGLFSVHPAVIAAIAALGADARSRGRVVRVENMQQNASSRYLERIGLFSALDVETPITVREHEAAGRFIPLRQVRTNDELNEFVLEIGPLLHAGPDATKAVKYALFELIRNVLEHSHSPSGAYVCAQVARDGRLMMGVADAGRGVLESMSLMHPVTTHGAAISLAFRPGVSGTSRTFGGNETNGGAGLFFTKAMAVLSERNMVMISGDSLMKLLKQRGRAVHPTLEEDRITWRNLSVPVPGTIVGIDLEVDEETGFERLFSDIRDAYGLSVRAQKKARYKARFSR